MMKFRFFIALYLAKFTMWFMHLVGRNATYLPGKLAIAICPEFLKYIARPGKIIAVTGTNGKTTVSNLLADVFTDRGEIVTDNLTGTNINAGIASALMSSATLGNRCRATVAILEVDERSSIRVYPYIKPDYAIVTNLFRDSINRNAHPAFIADFIGNYMPKETKLILPGYDLLAGSLAPENYRAYYGVELLKGESGISLSKINDLQLCPRCRGKLVYDWQHYHHIGQSHCPSCGLHSPVCDYDVLSYNEETGMLRVLVKGRELELKSPGPNISDIFNGCAVLALLSEMGFSDGELKESMSKIRVMASRHKDMTAKDGTHITCHMAKDLNAVACSRSFDYVRRDPGKKEVVLMMYNRELVVGSSENIAWIYDSDFEYLAGDEISRIVVAGPRSADFRLRLLLAGVKPEKLVSVGHEREAVDHLLYEKNEHIYILYGTDSIKEAMELQESIRKHIDGEAKA